MPGKVRALVLYRRHACLLCQLGDPNGGARIVMVHERAGFRRASPYTSAMIPRYFPAGRRLFWGTFYR